MSDNPFKAEELADAKLAFAAAWLAEVRSAPFKPDPFKAAIRLWNEDNGKLARALWVAHSGKWHEDEEVLEAVAEIQEQEQDDVKAEKAEQIAHTKTDEFKELIRFEMIEAMRADMNNKALDAKDRKDASDRLSKLMNLDEKPVVDESAGKVLGVIHHRLAPMDAPTFETAAAKQQAALQNELLELTATDATIIN